MLLHLLVHALGKFLNGLHDRREFLLLVRLEQARNRQRGAPHLVPPSARQLAPNELQEGHRLVQEQQIRLCHHDPLQDGKVWAEQGERVQNGGQHVVVARDVRLASVARLDRAQEVAENLENGNDALAESRQQHSPPLLVQARALLALHRLPVQQGADAEALPVHCPRAGLEFDGPLQEPEGRGLGALRLDDRGHHVPRLQEVVEQRPLGQHHALFARALVRYQPADEPRERRPLAALEARDDHGKDPGDAGRRLPVAGAVAQEAHEVLQEKTVVLTLQARGGVPPAGVV
mmetsp:Transcript_4211/g.7263  ORF Transcript_4211/g.7263 Transcript_4211/m.7263 type:complete len:290 (+) Transcript_4211:101-970(+)